MVPLATLRAALQSWPKDPGCVRVERAPLLTNGFPGTFNMSCTEHHWLGEYGGYVSIDHDYTFSTVQSCVRINDLELLARGHGQCHLGVFEMADLAGEVALATRPDYREWHGRHLHELVRFLGECGIDRNRVHASYCAGGSVRVLTDGAYRFVAEIPPDVVSREALLAAGIPERNLIADTSRDTLLALHVHRPTPWGYRNEIYVENPHPEGPRLIDVATGEYLVWSPIFANGGTDRSDIVGLEPLAGGAVGIEVGVERLCMVVNGLPRVHDVDYLCPFYAELRAILRRELEERDYVAGESLRALHRIYTDLHFHPEARTRRDADGRPYLSTKRRKKAALLKRNVASLITQEALACLLHRHSDAQPWHEHLDAGIAPTLDTIAAYRSSTKEEGAWAGTPVR